MGSGASTNKVVAAAIDGSSEADLKQVLSGLSADRRAKLLRSLGDGQTKKVPKKFTEKRLKQVFAKFDKDNSGSIGFKEVERVEKFFEIEASEAAPASWADGKITFDEFVKWLKKAGVPVKEAKKEITKPYTTEGLKAAFKTYDKDKSGFVGFEEVQAIEKFYNIPMEVSASAEDWKDGKISVDEFIGWVKKAGHKVKEKPVIPPPKALSMADLKKAFEGFDKDSSKKIGFAEVQAIEKFYNIPMEVSANAKDWADGVVSFEEFVGWVKKAGHAVEEPKEVSPPKPLSMEDLRKAFDGFDDDKSGKIGFEEVQAIEQFYNLPMEISARAADWADGVVSFEEFVDWIKKAGHAVEEAPKRPAKLSLDALTKSFNSFDKDKSGNIGFEEVQAIEKFYDIPMEVSSRMSDWTDGTISLKEFIGWVKDAGHPVDETALAPPGLTKAALEKEFQKYASAKTGKVGFAEVAAVEKAFNIPMEVSSAASDWQDGVIDFKEFCGWLEKAGHKLA